MVRYLRESWHYIRNLHTSRAYSKDSYYEVLKVHPNCTQKEIKLAYLKRSKELHPDKNPNDPKSQVKFVTLNEAYSVLSKPYVRRLYDKHLEKNPHNGNFFEDKAQQTTTKTTGAEDSWRDKSIWEMRDRDEDKYYEGKPYYGIKGLKRVPNSYVAMSCIVFMIIGIIGHYLAFKYGRGSSLELLNQKNKKIMNAYEELRKETQNLDRDTQIDKMKEKCSATRTNIKTVDDSK